MSLRKLIVLAGVGGAGVLAVRKVLALATVVGAAGALATPIVASADSQTSCTDPTNCKTVTVDSAGLLTSGSTSGVITLSGLAASTTYNLGDAMQSVAGGQQYIGGGYTISWGTCSKGSATGSSWTVTQSASGYPHTAPTSSGTLPTITSDASGAFSCGYTLVYPTITTTNEGCSSICSAKNDALVLNQSTGAVVGQVASFSVHPGGAPPAVTPEAPFAALLPLSSLLLLAGLGYVVYRRRSAAQA